MQRQQYRERGEKGEKEEGKRVVRGEAEKKNGDVVVVAECSLSFCCAPPREVSHTCAVIIQHGSNGNIKW